jgi:NTE family protein
VAFVLSSGANLGAAQVGMLRALIEHDVTPDLIVGCSVGAVNGASLAEDPTIHGVDRLDHLWSTVDGRQLMPRRKLPPAVALWRHGEAIQPADGLHQFVRRALTTATFEGLRVPFHCVATDVLEERERWFDAGPLADAVLASAAMPSMFPPVEIDGRRYIDGAVLVDVPIRRAAELGARTLYVLEVGLRSRARPQPRRPIDMAIQAYWVARRHRYQHELDALPDHFAVYQLPHGELPRVPVHDFSRGAELIRAAYRASTAYLDGIARQPGHLAPVPEEPAGR